MNCLGQGASLRWVGAHAPASKQLRQDGITCAQRAGRARPWAAVQGGRLRYNLHGLVNMMCIICRYDGFVEGNWVVASPVDGFALLGPLGPGRRLSTSNGRGGQDCPEWTMIRREMQEVYDFHVYASANSLTRQGDVINLSASGGRPHAMRAGALAKAGRRGRIQGVEDGMPPLPAPL